MVWGKNHSMFLMSLRVCSVKQSGRKCHMKWLSASPRCWFERENYRQIVFQCGVHRFDNNSFQTRADVGGFNGGDIILMIRKDGLDCSSFLLSAHASSYNFLFGISKHK